MGGLGGGPWLDGRMRMAHAAIGYAASAIDAKPDTYANVAQVTLLTDETSAVSALDISTNAAGIAQHGGRSSSSLTPTSATW